MMLLSVVKYKGTGVQECKKTQKLSTNQRDTSSAAEENKHETKTIGQRAGEQQVSRSKDKDRKWKVNMTHEDIIYKIKS